MPVMGVFAWRSPSIAKPPAGGLTAAVPVGGGGQTVPPYVWSGNNPAGIAAMMASLQTMWRRVLVFIFFGSPSSAAQAEVPRGCDARYLWHCTRNRSGFDAECQFKIS